jgi:hypothetical protein
VRTHTLDAVPAVDELLENLCAASRKQFVNPYTIFSWPDTLDGSKWAMAPELVSLAGMPEWEALPEQTQKRLSLLELANFFSLTLHGEKTLVERVVRFLYRRSYEEATRYLQHFIEEELQHITYFGEFCQRYAGKVYPDRHVSAGAPSYAAGEEEFSTFLAILIFEEVGNHFNIKLGRDERLHEIVQQINAHHRKEEARHLVFGRHVVAKLFAGHAGGWAPEVLERVQDFASSYLVETWKEYFSPNVYADVGLPNPFKLYEQALESPAAEARFREATGSCVEFLLALGVLKERPSYDV